MKPSGPGLLFAGRFLITVSISLLVMGLIVSLIIIVSFILKKVRKIVNMLKNDRE